MGFFEDAAADAAEVVAELGQSVTISPAAGGSPITCTAIFLPGRLIDPPGVSDLREMPAFGLLYMRPEDAPGWTPAPGDAVALSSGSYAVRTYGLSTPWLVVQITTTDGT